MAHEGGGGGGGILNMTGLGLVTSIKGNGVMGMLGKDRL